MSRTSSNKTFIKVINTPPTYRSEGPIGTWVYRIEYREAIAVTRRRSKEPVDANTGILN